MTELDELLTFGEHLALQAAGVILPHFRNCQTESKPDGSEVTIADLMAEERIRTLVSRKYPNHGLIGEEFGGSPARKGYTWVIDPIDGTTFFALGLPAFGTLIGLLLDGEPVAGVIHFPLLDETVLAARGSGCWRRIGGSERRRIQTSNDRPLRQAFCSASGVHASDLADDGADAHRLGAIVREARKFRVLGDCQQHALLCRGEVDLAIDTLMKPWDTAALVPCIREAGGVATSITGDAAGVVFSGSLLAACGPDLHGEALRTLAPRLVPRPPTHQMS